MKLTALQTFRLGGQMYRRGAYLELAEAPGRELIKLGRAEEVQAEGSEGAKAPADNPRKAPKGAATRREGVKPAASTQAAPAVEKD